MGKLNYTTEELQEFFLTNEFRNVYTTFNEEELNPFIEDVLKDIANFKEKGESNNSLIRTLSELSEEDAIAKVKSMGVYVPKYIHNIKARTLNEMTFDRFKYNLWIQNLNLDNENIVHKIVRGCSRKYVKLATDNTIVAPPTMHRLLSKSLDIVELETTMLSKRAVLDNTHSNLKDLKTYNLCESDLDRINIATRAFKSFLKDENKITSNMALNDYLDFMESNEISAIKNKIIDLTYNDLLLVSKIECSDFKDRIKNIINNIDAKNSELIDLSSYRVIYEGTGNEQILVMNSGKEYVDTNLKFTNENIRFMSNSRLYSELINDRLKLSDIKCIKFFDKAPETAVEYIQTVLSTF
ncbi:hypothetical protein [Paraclostridium bifermentans]|uniref:hypothetical protein n=1 Tax=Paraclostridium bifermentans TaxID=1490 RepID=UPI00374E7D8F